MAAGKHGCFWHPAFYSRHSFGVSRPDDWNRERVTEWSGFPYSYGIFQAYYSTHEPFASEPGGVAVIGTTATGLMFFGLPFGAMVAQRFPRIVRPSIVCGISLVVLSLVGASFCNSVAGLVATEGVLYGIGGILAYLPLLKLVDEWFVVRKGMAYGVMWAGTGAAGVIVPFLLEWLLDTYGFRTALRVWAIIIVCHKTQLKSKVLLIEH
jgi:MFS family permease